MRNRGLYNVAIDNDIEGKVHDIAVGKGCVYIQKRGVSTGKEGQCNKRKGACLLVKRRLSSSKKSGVINLLKSFVHRSRQLNVRPRLYVCKVVVVPGRSAVEGRVERLVRA